MLDRTRVSCGWKCFALAIVASAFCAPATAIMAGASPDTPAARIDANSTSSPWSGVGSVVVSGGVYSGVVVAPRFVLTAAHVVGSAAPSSIQFVLNYGGDQTHVIPALAVTRYPTASFPYDDLALVELTTTVPAGVAVYALARSAAAPGQRIVLVGYGSSGNGNVGVTVGGSRSVKRKGENVIDLIQTSLDTSGRSSLFYVYDFDGPTGSGSSGGATLGNATETVVAGGDSGSPAFAGNAEQYTLVGINTFVGSPSGGSADFRFGTIGGGILLTRPEFLEWIDGVTGYTTPGSSVDIPTLPQWATIIAMLMFAKIAWRARSADDRARARSQQPPQKSPHSIP